MNKKILKLLAGLGYMRAAEDKWLIEFSYDRAVEHIKSFCNTNKLPKELDVVVVMRAAGEFLFVKKQSGQLADFELDAAIKQISIGDTSTTFDVDSSQSEEERLNSLIEFLRSYGEGALVRSRKIRW